MQVHWFHFSSPLYLPETMDENKINHKRKRKEISHKLQHEKL
jgi:hypothetical protein